MLSGPFRPKSEAESLLSLPRMSVRPLPRFAAQAHPGHNAQGIYFRADTGVEQEWTDEELYERYGLTKNEIAFIESA